MEYTFSLEDSDYLKVLFAEWMKSWDELAKLFLQLEVDYRSLELQTQIHTRLHHAKKYSSFIGITEITKLIYRIGIAIEDIHSYNIIVDEAVIDCLLNAHELINIIINAINHQLIDSKTQEDGIVIAIDDQLFTGINDSIAQLTSSVNKAKENKAAVAALDEVVVQHQEISSTASLTQNDITALTESIKEKFIFDMFQYVDQIDGVLAILERAEHQEQALIQLKHIVHKLNRGIDEFSRYDGIEGMMAELLQEMLEVGSAYEKLLNHFNNQQLTYFHQLAFKVSYETAYFLREVLDTMMLEQERNCSNKELLNSIMEVIENSRNTSSQQAPYNLPKKWERETNSSDLPAKSLSTQSIRVSQDKLDKMMNMISELLITKNTFLHASDKINIDGGNSQLSKEVKQIGSMVNRISDELQKAIMSMRMVEVNTLFQKIPRIIRDASQNTGKKMKLVMKGETTEIDKTIIEQISDPIVHLIRNAADHGIESGEERLAKGKDETGVITLRAYNMDKHVCIEIEDDGKGIDAQFVKQKAINKGFITEEQAEKMSQNQLIQLIFLPGFSTAEQVTELSGRGVGMDVVRSNIEKINGNISINSEINKGTKIIIYLPLTLAVSRGLTVKVGTETYIIPIDYVSETVKINIKDIHEYNGKKFVYLRGEVVSIDWLSSLFLLEACEQSSEGEVNTVILTNGQEKLGLVVDKLLNEQEFVIKTLSGHLAAIPGISGSTLLGSGQVVLIINPLDLMQLAKT